MILIKLFFIGFILRNLFNIAKNCPLSYLTTNALRISLYNYYYYYLQLCIIAIYFIRHYVFTMCLLYVNACIIMYV